MRSIDEDQIIGPSYSPSIGVGGRNYYDIVKRFSGSNSNLTKMIITELQSSVGEKQPTKTNHSCRNDYFVRWGWLEDNIFSRYSSYINNKNEILSAIRSIELVVDSNGDLQINEDGSVDYDSVLIRNNPKYLLPKDPLKFIFKVRTSAYNQ